jgi:hypothetical protein
MQGPAYTPPFPEWYYKVILPPRVKPPTEFTKFSGQDDTSTVEHIARYLMQLGEASSEEAFRVRYFSHVTDGPSVPVVHIFASPISWHMEGAGAKIPHSLLQW